MKSTAVFLSIAVVASFPVWSGCSLSYSSKSISKSVSSPFTSSSKSSSPEEEEAKEVEETTAAHVEAGGDAMALRREIGAVAAKHGVTDWETDEPTFRGIGAGLAKAGQRQVEVDAFKDVLATSPKQAEWLQGGYDSAR